MQYKQNACSTGVYDVQCTDGNQAGLAEFKRVQALSARYRANQMSPIAKAQAKYDAKLYARNISRCCSYEEDLVRPSRPFCPYCCASVCCPAEMAPVGDVATVLLSWSNLARNSLQYHTSTLTLPFFDPFFVNNVLFVFSFLLDKICHCIWVAHVVQFNRFPPIAASMRPVLSKY